MLAVRAPQDLPPGWQKRGVWDGRFLRTASGMKKSDLVMNKRGKIVSKIKSEQAKARYNSAKILKNGLTYKQTLEQGRASGLKKGDTVSQDVLDEKAARHAHRQEMYGLKDCAGHGTRDRVTGRCRKIVRGKNFTKRQEKVMPGILQRRSARIAAAKNRVLASDRKRAAIKKPGRKPAGRKPAGRKPAGKKGGLSKLKKDLGVVNNDVAELEGSAGGKKGGKKAAGNSSGKADYFRTKNKRWYSRITNKFVKASTVPARFKK